MNCVLRAALIVLHNLLLIHLLRKILNLLNKCVELHLYFAHLKRVEKDQRAPIGLRQRPNERAQKLEMEGLEFNFALDHFNYPAFLHVLEVFCEVGSGFDNVLVLILLLHQIFKELVLIESAVHIDPLVCGAGRAKRARATRDESVLENNVNQPVPVIREKQHVFIRLSELQMDLKRRLFVFLNYRLKKLQRITHR